MKNFIIIGLLSFFALSGKLYAQEGAPQQQRAERQAQEADLRQEQEWQEHRVQRRQWQEFQAGTRELRSFTPEMRERQRNIFTEQLELTPEEAEQFWRLYFRHESERDSLNRIIRRQTRVRPAQGERPVFDVSNLSDAEAQQLVDYRAKLIDLQRQFHNDLTELLSPQRVLAFYEAERIFQRELVNAMNRVRAEQQQRQGGRGGRGQR